MKFAYIATTLFTVSALGAPNTDRGVIEIPLIKRNPLGVDPNKPVNFAILDQHLQHVTAKHFGKRNDLEKRQGTEEPLSDRVIGGIDTEYYGTISVGTPGQNLAVDFDTGSNALWVNGKGCQQGCTDAWYDQTASSTFSSDGTPFTLKYGSLQVSGQVDQDTVSIAGLTVTQLVFGYAINVTTTHPYEHAQGVMGLAFDPKPKFGVTTFFEQLYYQSQIRSLIFGVYFARGSQGKTGSKLTLGNYDQELAGGTPHWTPVKLGSQYWVIPLDSIDVNGNEAVPTSEATIDTGSSLVYGPSRSVKALYDKIPGAKLSTIHPSYYSFPCKQDPNITFSFSSMSYSMSFADLNLGQESEGSPNCIGSIVSYGSVGTSNDETQWLIGVVFLKNVYTVFDMLNAQVGFSTLNSF